MQKREHAMYLMNADLSVVHRKVTCKVKAGVAQMEERPLRKREVAGSKPAASSIRSRYETVTPLSMGSPAHLLGDRAPLRASWAFPGRVPDLLTGTPSGDETELWPAAVRVAPVMVRGRKGLQGPRYDERNDHSCAGAECQL